MAEGSALCPKCCGWTGGGICSDCANLKAALLPPDPPNPVERYVIDKADGALIRSYDGPLVYFSEHEKALQAEVEKREELEAECDRWRGEAVEQREARSGEAFRAITDRISDELVKPAGTFGALSVAVALTAASDDRARAAEGKLASVVEELERRAIEESVAFDTYQAEDNRTGMAIRSARLSAFNTAAQLLRDKGTEQGGGDASDATGKTYDRPSVSGAGVSIEGDPGPKWCGECGLKLSPDTPPGVHTGHVHQPVAGDVMAAAWSVYAVAEAIRRDYGAEDKDLAAARKHTLRILDRAGISEQAVRMYAGISTQQQLEQSTTGKEDCER